MQTAVTGFVSQTRALLSLIPVVLVLTVIVAVLPRLTVATEKNPN